MPRALRGGVNPRRARSGARHAPMPACAAGFPSLLLRLQPPFTPGEAITRLRHARLGLFGRNDRGAVRAAREGEGEGGALALTALYRQVALHRAGQVAADGQAQPRALAAARER